ncbi:MAG: pyrimidine/purine nucleoside phosphorylase [Pseudodesulfovibrio sp.]|uniref:Pyrimidine/purine nucleoside phosphorylase n=1 Tax=Pseudodesulfovibrio aespoeensis (strain ATCC 700646 / DSM 10631 / Aspo-2) TaxID=643562 RepID=E6VVM8_PSEA9|nr:MULTISPECIES: pyrimidine/purine nucleoside phosphorylase [Pseudodesulfovibrio]MBU4243558.1 pyrimidine/purine nucleoside phosphorylase [Pseudomonadota bacterium]ADU63586.1 protein of unknown function DUF1255 [Pseudodesulfovibrio aespoeensis Aspo-2]MBU4378505.1 pyrimidine/purine nucleoside phosphorylase [Pseudomonadota bacterium]MBU4475305.1 pyrimidine/purine nucleoside phosphorylase [Pseudomonadota bacterium]MBU4514756.1 pyrimidine/purine nucleoside phosphorylase [Pseudomonadota bacterium]
MSEFTNVTVEKKANIYFDGKVTSRTVILADGSRKTLGIMLPGDYEFGTDAAEVMEIAAGRLSVLLPGSETWIEVSAGGSFEVPGSSRFKLKVAEVVDYCCSYAG